MDFILYKSEEKACNNNNNDNYMYNKTATIILHHDSIKEPERRQYASAVCKCLDNVQTTKVHVIVRITVCESLDFFLQVSISASDDFNTHWRHRLPQPRVLSPVCLFAKAESEGLGQVKLA